MSDNKSEPFAAAGSGKSDAEVAFDLLNKLKGQGVWGERNMPTILDMFSECLDAVKGYRAYEGQNRVEMPIRRVSISPNISMGGEAIRRSQAQPSAQAQASLSPPPAPQQVAPAPQGQHGQGAPAANPVQNQQAQLQQQLYKP